jgi:uncharacterized protein YhhL (DUF1145 family)
MEHDFEKTVNMKLILRFFEELSGLKINFHKSEIFCFRKSKEEEQQYKSLVAKLALFLFGILEYLSITENSEMLDGIQLKPVSLGS